ncbi:AbrB/MazE/SpoVT family DNA-binding domain-containing protein [Candidatus Woesearchaeota archaeon]|nr:AbrB/MazE/SpoVT family DNA-binding domain-containing protein [Candidatus Woesearchaeota archaeon]MBI2580871.1 AbrB/MazE/SpoVT family DNA-binding domain-containing protein [Candidatus Woesearchaeota archaeon]MBI3036567.1 AbrB/MazE/SpoVT family DNA-binding domain-containing protein [Candidatus Woesearchaeota archaeon]
MQFKTKIGKKWEVIIPKAILDDFGVSPGEEIIMIYEENKLIIRKP